MGNPGGSLTTLPFAYGMRAQCRRPRSSLRATFPGEGSRICSWGPRRGRHRKRKWRGGGCGWPPGGPTWGRHAHVAPCLSIIVGLVKIRAEHRAQWPAQWGCHASPSPAIILPGFFGTSPFLSDPGTWEGLQRVRGGSISTIRKYIGQPFD